MLTPLIARIRALLSSRRVAGEIDEELHDHVERETAENIRRGRSPAEARRQALPLRDLDVELFAAGFRQRVEARAAVVLGRSPVGHDPALVLEPVQRRIERALPHLEQIVRDLLNPLRDRPSVHRFQGDGPHYQKVESALQDVGLIAHALSLVDWPMGKTIPSLAMFRESV